MQGFLHIDYSEFIHHLIEENRVMSIRNELDPREPPCGIIHNETIGFLVDVPDLQGASGATN